MLIKKGWFNTLDNNKIASGSCDNTIKIWNITSFKNIMTLTNHTDCITSLISINLNFIKNENPLLVSASKDKTIKFWEIEQKKLILTLKKT